MKAWLERFGSYIALGAIVLAVLAGLLVLKSCNDARTAGTQTKLATGQKDAAIDSGHDAVETLGNATANETAIHGTVKDGTDEIQKAPAGDSNAAAERATCRLRSYRRTSKCVALLGPAPQ